VRREAQNGHRGAIVWFTGLSGSGKSTLAHAIEELYWMVTMCDMDSVAT
jgi:adenylylsulfate kinase-like enzyme